MNQNKADATEINKNLEDQVKVQSNALKGLQQAVDKDRDENARRSVELDGKIGSVSTDAGAAADTQRDWRKWANEKAKERAQV